VCGAWYRDKIQNQKFKYKVRHFDYFILLSIHLTAYIQ
jgi:hypothetical protein